MTARDAESDLSPFQAIDAFSVPSGQFHAHRCSGTSAPSVRQLIMVKVGNPVAVIQAAADTSFAPATWAVRRDVFNK